MPLKCFIVHLRYKTAVFQLFITVLRYLLCKRTVNGHITYIVLWQCIPRLLVLAFTVCYGSECRQRYLHRYPFYINVVIYSVYIGIFHSYWRQLGTGWVGEQCSIYIFYGSMSAWVTSKTHIAANSAFGFVS